MKVTAKNNCVVESNNKNKMKKNKEKKNEKVTEKKKVNLFKEYKIRNMEYCSL